MSSRSRTDAVVVNYNAGEWLARCIGTLLGDDGPASLTVVDNASSDDSLDTLPGDPRLEILRNDANRGYAAAANQGAAAPEETREYLLFANPDLEVPPGTVGRLEALLDSNPEIGIAGVEVVGPDGREQRACRRRTPTAARSAVTMMGLDRLGFEGVNIRDEMPSQAGAVDGVSGAFLFVRRACFEALGGFDEGYFLHCEDLDLFERARAAGWAVWFVPGLRVVHAKGISHARRRCASEWDKHQGMVRFYRRFLAPRTAAPLRWIWPALVRAHFVLGAPWWWLRDRLGARG